MISVAASQFQRQFGHFKEVAQKEPVVITSYDRLSVVLISADEFKVYQEFKNRQATALYAWELSDDELQALTSSDISPEAKQFNDEYKA